MEISSPQILFMFVAMGGIIAYLGDWLGRKMGKKRLRIGGLRPRHTATAFTVIMGMLIPIATTYAIVTISAPVRQWLAEGPELAKERNNLIAQINQLREEADRRTQELSNKEHSLKLAVSQQKLAAERTKVAQSEVKRVQVSLQAARTQQAKIRSRVNTLESRANSLAKGIADKTVELEQQQKELNKSLAEVTRLRKESGELMENSIQLYRQIQDLEERTKEETERAEKARRERNEAQTEAQQWYERIIDLRRIVMDLQQTQSGLERGIEAVRTRNIVFRKGEELGRITLTGGLDADSARAKIMQLVAICEVTAKERGVKPDASGYAASLNDIVRRLPDGSTITISVEDQIGAFVRGIAETKDDLVLIASAYMNYFDFEEKHVPIALNMYKNLPVYKSNEVIAETIIDGTNSDAEVFDAIIEFLRTGVRAAALDAGMIPVHADEGSVGEIGYEQMVTLVNQIRNRQGKVKVAAIAAKTTRAADTLTLKFKVNKI